MASLRVIVVSGCGLLLITAAILAQTADPKANPPRPPIGQPAVPDPRLPASSAAVNGAFPLGPLDPGPYPLMPGYFTRKAADLNYRQTPFFNRCETNYPGFGVGRDFFPGVYPAYDAQYHYQWYQAYHREQQLTQRAEQMRGEAIDLFRRGEYETAAIRFLGAADVDHGDAAARVHAGHCLFALGQYADAVALLRRAFELQPALAYGGFDPRSDYGHRADFQEQLQTLRDYVDHTPDDAAATALLGYMIYFTDGSTRARPTLEKARRLNPDDGLVARLLAVASKASWNEAVARTTRRDARTYDQMGVRPKSNQPYHPPRRPTGNKSKPEWKKVDGNQTRRI